MFSSSAARTGSARNRACSASAGASMDHRRHSTCLQMFSNVINALYIWQFAIPDTGHEHLPLLVNVANKVDEQGRERYSEMLQVATCEEEEAVDDQKRRKVSDHGRCPWYSVAWH